MSHTDNTILDQHPTSSSAPNSSSKAPPGPSQTGGVSGADLIELLREARMALGPEYCGYAGSLAGRIDDVLHGDASPPLPSAPTADVPLPGLRDDLVLESYGAGYAFLKPVPICVRCGSTAHWSIDCMAAVRR